MVYKTVLALTATASLAAAGPCDIYASGGTPCVAAHSTTRALYNNYAGSLYQVLRGSDNATTDIKTVSAGGIANSATQDSFCAGSTCLISVIYDQSGRNNHLTQAPPGGAAPGPNSNRFDYLAGAFGAPVTLGGKKVYGVFSSPFTGYRNDATNGIAVGEDPEGMYALFDGTHYNTACCFDYGNAEPSNLDTGMGHMETIYFGTGDGSPHGKGAGSGPWIMADLENGLISGLDYTINQGDPTVTYRFLTAIIKGQKNNWAIRGGDAGAGTLSTFYNGARPAGYTTMYKEGAIVLGVGGDNSNGAQGTFYEGAMTAGFPSDATENAVQQNIKAAGYGTTSLSTGPALSVGSRVSFRVTTPTFTDRYIAHTGATVNTQVVSASSDGGLKQQASWTVRAGLADGSCFSFESVDSPGQFIRHANYQLMVNTNDNSKIFHEDSTFCTQPGVNGQGTSFRSWSYAARYWRHYAALGYIAGNSGPHEYDNPAMFNDDISFVVTASFA